MAYLNFDTAKNLIDQYGLTEEDCSKVVSDLHLDLLAQSCCAGGAWKTLAPHLELERAVVEDIDRKQVDDNEKRSAFFYQWKQMKGREATYMKLVRALLYIQRRMDAEKLLKLLHTASVSPTSIAFSRNPDPSSLPTDLQRDLKQQLRFNLNDIKKKYTLFVECVRTSITKKGITAKELSTFLLSQSVFDYDEQDYKLFSDKKDVLEAAMDIYQIFNLLNTEYASFLNYEIFLDIAEKYELMHGQKEMNYPQYLHNYINKQKVSEFLIINPTLLKYSDSSKKITLKFDIKPTCKLAKVKELSEAIADKMKWNPSAVRILGIDQGCIVVTLIIPANLADYVFTRDAVFTEKQREDFIHLNVLLVKFNEKVYDFKQMQAVHDMSLPISTDPINKSGADIKWTDYYGRTAFQAGGTRHVLIIVSEDVCGPDVVQRRPAIQLTEEWRGKLENQGIAREHQSDDLTIVKARYSLDKTYTDYVEVSHPERNKMTKLRVLKQIEILMKNSRDTDGVVIHYIGAGKRNTGDWCFEDGFITFRELAHLYLQFLRGRVMSITTDCSHSGSWVRECMAFLDEQRVGPCGHCAKNRKILISIFASCQYDEIPRQLAYSMHGCLNDQETQCLFFKRTNVAEAQHSTGINFTIIRCGSNSIAEECKYLYQTTWYEWIWHDWIMKKRKYYYERVQ